MSLLDALRTIRDGEDDRRPAAGLAAGEDGLISLIAAVTVLMFLALAILLGNALLVVNEKIETQNAADAVALSAGTQMARGLNAVTGAQHLMGELLALVVVHNAIGGEDPTYDEQDTTALDTALSTAAAAVIPPGPFTNQVKEQIGSKVKVKEALLEAHKSLKLAATIALALEAVGQALQKFPLTAPAGVALSAAAWAMEGFMLVEWVALTKGLEVFAVAGKEAAKLIFDQAPGAVKTAIEGVERSNADRMKQTAEQVARMNGVGGAIYPEGMRLPLALDPLANARSKEEMKKSQLVRASWPYVAYHRSLLLDLTGWMVFSRFASHYRKKTEEMMLKKSYEIYSNRRLILRVMDGLKAPDNKGEESWTRSPAEAEQRFAVLGFARRAAPTPWGGALFRPTKGRDLITYSQALVYNANKQRRGAPGRLQQEIGWDALNWRSPVSGSNAYEYPNAGSGNADRQFPQVRLNWQVKLIPVTRLGAAKRRLAAPFADLLRDADESAPMAKTH